MRHPSAERPVASRQRRLPKNCREDMLLIGDRQAYRIDSRMWEAVRDQRMRLESLLPGGADKAAAADATRAEAEPPSISEKLHQICGGMKPPSDAAAVATPVGPPPSETRGGGLSSTISSNQQAGWMTATAAPAFTTLHAAEATATAAMPSSTSTPSSTAQTLPPPCIAALEAAALAAPSFLEAAMPAMACAPSAASQGPEGGSCSTRRATSSRARQLASPPETGALSPRNSARCQSASPTRHNQGISARIADVTSRLSSPTKSSARVAAVLSNQVQAESGAAPLRAAIPALPGSNSSQRSAVPRIRDRRRTELESAGVSPIGSSRASGLAFGRVPSTTPRSRQQTPSKDRADAVASGGTWTSGRAERTPKESPAVTPRRPKTALPASTRPQSPQETASKEQDLCFTPKSTPPRPKTAPFPRGRQAENPLTKRSLNSQGVKAAPSKTGRALASTPKKSRTCVTPLLDLDSDMSEDEEEAELRVFWQRFRSHGAATASERVAEALSSTGIPLQKTSTPFAQHKDAPELGASPKQGWSHKVVRQTWLCSQMPSPCFLPSSPSKGQIGRVGSQLWQYPEDVGLEILGWLHFYAICALACAGRVLRSLCCVDLGTGWRWKTVSPHLQLDTAVCGELLQQVWLPKTLWLDARDLSVKACGMLFRALEAPGACLCKSLLTVDLRNSKLGDAAPLGKLIRTCTGLRALQLGRTRLKDGGAAHVLRSLAVEPSTGEWSPHLGLRALALEENGLTSLSGPGLAQALRAARLETLVLARNELGDDGVQALADALAQSSGRCLECLDLSENKVSSIGFGALLAGLAGSRSLRSLDLGGNDAIGPSLPEEGKRADDGSGRGDSNSSCSSEVVAKRLASLAGLEKLQLWRCGLADPWCLLLAGSLAVRPPRLRLLNLAANPISKELKSQLLHSPGPGDAEILL